MSNEVKLNNLKTMRQEVLAKIDNLVKSLEKLKEYESLPEGKKRDGKEKDYSLKLSELVSLKEELNKLDSDIKTVEANVKEEEKARKAKEAERAKKTKKSEKKKTSKKVVKKEKGNAATIVIASVGVVALAATLFTMGRCSAKKNTSCNTNKKTNSCGVVTVTSTPVAKNSNGEEVELVVTPTPAPVLVDVTNEEDVRKAAERIYNEDVKSVLESENDEVLNFYATRENIVDIIRVLNGEFPINSEFDANTLDKTIQLHADIFANRGSVDNQLYTVSYEHFFEDGSIEAMYAKSYDDVYKKIAEYRREGNVDGFTEQVGVLESKLYNEWYLAGLYGGFNPYAFDENKQYLAFLAATSRISNFVTEYIQDLRIEDPNYTVCIPTCYNKNGEQEYRSFEEIEMGLYTGKSFDGEVICKRDNQIFIPATYTYNELKNSLLEKTEAQIKALK